MHWQLHPIADFSRFATEWDRLAADAGGVPFLSSRFIVPLLEHFGSGGERLATCGDATGVSAMTLVRRRGWGLWETFQPSQLPLGPWLMRPGADLVALAHNLLRTLPGFPLQLGVTQLDPAMYERPVDGGAVNALDYVATAAVSIDGTFDEYWNARGKNLRANMRKQRNRLAGENIAVRVEATRSPEAMIEAIDDYGRLEGAGWKAAGGTAIAPGNTQALFYRKMLENFAEVGYARVYRLYFNEKVVAMDLCIASADMEVVLKTTYDETITTLSPAFLLREHALRTHFDEGRVQRVEFFGKVMDWHTQWTRDARMLYHVNIARYGWLTRMRGLRAKADATPGSDTTVTRSS